jgi:hypothetical protein
LAISPLIKILAILSNRARHTYLHTIQCVIWCVKKDTVNLALKEFVYRHKQLEIINIFGKMDTDSNYDYKRGRTR